MSSNAWDRAQRAITRAEERDAAVVTPDNAVSPYDASATAVIPHAELPGRRRGQGGQDGQGRHQRPEDATTDVHASTAVDGQRSGRRRRPSPHPAPGVVDGTPPDEPPTTPVAVSADAPPTDPTAPADDTPTENVATSPEVPLRRRPRPDTSPFEAVGGPGGHPDPEVVPDADPPRRRGFWARLFGRR